MAEKKKVPPKSLQLEEAFVKLDEIVEKLESEDATLEESFAQYKAGMDLLKQCNETIDKVEKKVLVLNQEGGTDEF